MNCGQLLDASLSCTKCGFTMTRIADLLKRLQDSTLISFHAISQSTSQQLAEILSMVDFSNSIERFDRVRKYVDFIKTKNLQPPDRSLAFEFFDYSIQSYVYGFDHAVIYHAALASELAIASRVGRALPVAKLLRKARSFLNPTQILDATTLSRLRNCYVHYQNMHLFAQAQNAEIVDQMASWPEIPGIDKDELHRLLEHFDRLHKRRFPVDWETSAHLKSYRQFLDRRSEAFMKWRRENGPNPIRYLQDSVENNRIGRGCRWFDRWAYDAFEAIQICDRVLTALGAYDKI